MQHFFYYNPYFSRNNIIRKNKTKIKFHPNTLLLQNKTH